jgi:hypothetical protein
VSQSGIWRCVIRGVMQRHESYMVDSERGVPPDRLDRLGSQVFGVRSRSLVLCLVQPVS